MRISELHKYVDKPTPRKFERPAGEPQIIPMAGGMNEWRLEILLEKIFGPVWSEILIWVPVFLTQTLISKCLTLKQNRQ